MTRPPRLLAVDVDGTLLHDGRIDPADRDALARAAVEGVTVCLCTGRSWREVRPIWESLDLPAPHAPVVCVGGALVAEPDTGRTLYSRPFDRPAAAELAGYMHRAGYPVMALVDAWREGFDYFLIGRCDGNPVYGRFFDGRELGIRPSEGLDPADGPRTLRVSVLDEEAPADRLLARLRRDFAGRIECQRVHLPHAGVHVVETFRAGATKLTALAHVGQGYRIAPAAMAAIGDDHNDIPMLAGVGLSAAPADAPEEVRRAAHLTVAPRGQGGVAEFVGKLLSPAR
ncbi:MAG TPA: HAD family hydrolase [Phycisphaerae bacterium]|nr:HAD family hydrolase [Phycisphaerae bacterium]